MNEIKVMQYVLEQLENKDLAPEASKKALITIMTKLLDKGIADIPAEDDPATKNDGCNAWAGYADDMTALPGQEASIDEIIDQCIKKNTLQTLRGKYNKQLPVPTDNVSKSIFNSEMEYGKIESVLATTSQYTKDHKDKFVNVLLEKNNEVFRQISRRLNPFDKMVFCTVAELIRNGIFECTKVQLWRYMYGKGKKLKPTPEQEKMMDDSLHIMGGIFITLDVKELLECYPEIKKIQTAGTFLEIQKWAERKTANGIVSEYYVFGQTMPILMQYAYAVNQIQSLDAIGCSFYDTNIRKTALNQQAVNMIAERLTTIKGMKAKGKRVTKQMHVMNFDKLLHGIDYSTCKSDSAKLNKRNRQIKQIEKHLMFQQTRNNVQYTIEKTGITIDVD